MSSSRRWLAIAAAGRRLQCCGLLLLAVFGTCAARADAVQDACETLVLDYAYYRDRPDADGVANLFTADATLRVMGSEFNGRDKIRERILQGVGGPVFRHMMSTIRIFPLDEAHARGVSYVTVYTAPPGDLPRPVDSFVGLGEYHDEFVRTEAGWKIKRRDFVPVFAPATAD